MTAITEPIDAVPTGIDVTDWLIADARDVEPNVTRWLDDASSDGNNRNGNTALATVKRIAGAALVEQIAQALRSVMHESVADVVLDAFRGYRPLINAAQRSAETTTDVTHILAPFEVNFERDPSVVVMINGQPVATLTATLSLVFRVTDMVAVFHAGWLTELKDGETSVVGVVHVAGEEALRRGVSWHLPQLIPVGTGIPFAARRFD